MHLPVLLLTMNCELHKSKELWLCCMHTPVQYVFSTWHIVEIQLTILSKWINGSKCHQLVNLVKFSSTVKKTEKHSEAFKNSGKAALVSSSLEHESKQTKLTMKENQIKDKSNKKYSEMEKP